MLNKIVIKNVFAHKNTTIEFKEGLTRLHGANEAGKSQVFEMVRWALFGGKALRTATTDYNGGSVTLTFNGDYIVHRTTGSATLHKGTELLARSTTAVNKKIIEIVGYGLKTFDNVNSIQQDEVQKLTKLKAEDRKKFLDELIGAAQIDSLVSEYKAEAQILGAELEALNGQLMNAIEPKEPNVGSLEDIEGQLDGLQAERADLRVQERVVESLRNDLNKVSVAKDLMPEFTIEQLEDRLEKARLLDAAVKKVRIEYPQIARIYDMGARQLDVAALKSDVEDVLAWRSVRKPDYTISEIKELAEKHKANDAHLEILRLQAELETYTRCPGFEKEHTATVDKINALLPTARPYNGLPSREALKEQEDLNYIYETRQENLKEVESPYASAFSDPVDFSQGVYDRILGVLDNPVEDILSLYSTINAKRGIALRQEKEKELENAEKLLDPLAISAVDAKIEALRLMRSTRQRYETELRYYREAMDKNEQIEEKISKKKIEQSETANVVKSLQGFKYYINTYFLPSVSKAASAMLVTMTNGKRKRIHITDKFEITVDGNQVEAMSGSTKAIINIALRFALQFVLTKNSFSVFMADEVDGAMDKDRADYLNECLGNMTTHIKQVIVISHKDITATHNIKL